MEKSFDTSLRHYPKGQFLSEAVPQCFGLCYDKINFALDVGKLDENCLKLCFSNLHKAYLENNSLNKK